MGTVRLISLVRGSVSRLLAYGRRSVPRRIGKVSRQDSRDLHQVHANQSAMGLD